MGDDDEFVQIPRGDEESDDSSSDETQDQATDTDAHAWLRPGNRSEEHKDGNGQTGADIDTASVPRGDTNGDEPAPRPEEVADGEHGTEKSDSPSEPATNGNPNADHSPIDGSPPDEFETAETTRSSTDSLEDGSVTDQSESESATTTTESQGAIQESPEPVDPSDTGSTSETPASESHPEDTPVEAAESNTEPIQSDTSDRAGSTDTATDDKLSWAEQDVPDDVEGGFKQVEDEESDDDEDEDQFEPESSSVPDEFEIDDASNWEREVEHVYEPADTHIETLQRIDEFLDDIEEDLPTARERVRASEHFKLHDRLGQDTRAQDKLGFDYVRDDGIAVDGDNYIGIVTVSPRDWQMLSPEQKVGISQQYMSFLKTLKHPIAIPAYPREFDLTKHLELVYETSVRQSADDRHPLLDYGRKYYQVWLDATLDTENIRKRDYYIVFQVKKGHIAGGISNSRLVSRLPVIGSMYDAFIEYFTNRKTDDEVQEEVCIKEVDKRQDRIIGAISSTGVTAEKVNERDEAMEILYHYYNNVEPKLQEFNHGTGVFDITGI